MIQQIDTKELWQNALTEIELHLSKTTFATWFKNTHIVDIVDGTVRVGVANEFIREWFISKHSKLILKTLRDACEQVRSVEYVISKSEPVSQTKVEKKAPEHNQALFADVVQIKEDGLNPRYTFESFVVGPFNELAYVAAQSIINNPPIIIQA